MSRGIGKLQRDILAWLGDQATGVCFRDVVKAMTPCGTPYNPAGLRASVHRAIHALAARGLAETDRGFVGGATAYDDEQLSIVRLPGQPWPSHFFGGNQHGSWQAAVAAWRAWCNDREQARKRLRATSSTAVDEVALNSGEWEAPKRYAVPAWDGIALNSDQWTVREEDTQ